MNTVQRLREAIQNIQGHNAYRSFVAAPIQWLIDDLEKLVKDIEADEDWRNIHREEMRAAALTAAARTYMGTNGTDETIMACADKFCAWIGDRATGDYMDRDRAEALYAVQALIWPAEREWPDEMPMPTREQWDAIVTAAFPQGPMA